MLKVNLEKVKEVLEYLQSIDNHNLEDIDWYFGSEKLTVSHEEVAYWKYAGMSNKYFGMNLIKGRV